MYDKDSGGTVVGAFGSGGGGGSGNVTSTGAYGSEPGSPATGDVVFYNNSFYVARWNGTIWELWGPVFPMTEPDDSAFSWVNQGGASTDTTKGGIVLTTPAAAAFSLRIRKQAAPATPWKKTIALVPHMNPRGTGASGVYGALFRESSSGKLHSLSLWPSGAGVQQVLSSTKWTNPTTASATYFSSNPYYTALPLFVRLGDDGTNRTIEVSWDGANFGNEPLHSVGRTDFLTADEWGFFVSAPDTGYGMSVTVLSIA